MRAFLVVVAYHFFWTQALVCGEGVGGGGVK